MTRPFRLRVVSALSLAACLIPTFPTHVWAADCAPRYQVTGTVSNQGFGSAVATIGDVNGDGFPDFAVGAPAKNPGPTQINPEVYVFSGHDGNFVHKSPGPIQSEFGSAIAALGDINGDHVPDFLVGAPESVGPGGGCIFAISGANGGVIYDFEGQESGAQLGSAIVGLGDVNGDGVPDFAGGAPHAAGMQPDSGAVVIVSGATGGILSTIPGEAMGDRFGASVAVLGSINPGPPAVQTLVIGAPGADVTNAAGTLLDAGAVYEVALPIGPPTRMLAGNHAGDHFGASVAALGDLDGDGSADFAVGAPDAPVPPGVEGGSVSVYLASAINPIGHHNYLGMPGDAFGAAIRGTADVTGDGISDVLVGAPGDPNAAIPHPGSLSVFSNGSGLELCRISGFAGSAERFGAAVAALGDLDGDGFPEWIGSAPEFSVGPVAPLGQVRVFGVAPGPPPGHPRMIDLDENAAGIQLSWTPGGTACAGFDYAVYMGRYVRMGQGLANHLPDTCTTGGATQLSIPLPANFPPGTAIYFIATAQSQGEEGSYGQGTLGGEHPPSSRPCQVFLNTGMCQ